MVLVALAALFVIAGAQANPPEQAGLFELDKNAQNNITTTLLGQLGGNINASVQTFTVCQASSTNPSPLPITIQIDAEQMTVGAIANAGGGGCQGAFKRTYSSVTRGVNGTTAASHGASGVSGRVTLVVTDNAKAGDDWDQVYAAVQANGPPSEDVPNPCSGPNWTGNAAATACTWIHDLENQSIFIGGGSKDDLDINEGTPPNLTPNWEHTDGSVPDADDIADAFAAKYVAGGREFLYFGADRTAVNGAKDMGFWFFKNPVSTNPDGTFNGQHTVGDILLLGTFTEGGATTNIRVFKWVGSGGNTNNVLQSGGLFGDCVPGGSSDGCNTVNHTTVQSPWEYQSKISGSPADTLYAGALMEGGVDLTALNLSGCFASFLAETRSSPEVGAQLKDFTLGEFETCDASLTTTPADGEGTALTDGPDADTLPEITIGTGSAGVDVTDQANLTVTGTSTWSGTLHFFLCGPIASGTCTTGGLEIGSGTAVNQDTDMPVISGTANLTSVGRYCWRGFFDSNTAFVDDQTDASTGECFEVLPVTPTLTTTAVRPTSGLSPTIVDGLADLNGDGLIDSSDSSTDFYGDTEIISGALDCDAWAADNDGVDGDGTIDGSDNCTLIGVPNVTIQVVAGEFQTGDGPLPTVFNAANPTNPDVGDSDFAWSTIFGKVDSNGDEVIDGNECHFGIIGDADILGDDPSCGSGTPDPLENGKVDLNGDGSITDADSCTNGCFFGENVANGLVVVGTVPFGVKVYDIATLTGTANQPGTNGPNATYNSINATNGAPANGTITFTLVGPDGDTPDCTTEATSDDATEDNPETVTVSGDGDYQTSGFTPDAPGDYHWKASYSGDPPPPATPLNTLGTSHNDDCSEAGEDVTVEQIPTTISTRQRVYPNDAARIASTKPGDNIPAGGTVTFRLYGPTDTATALENCQAHGTTQGSGGLLYVESKTTVGGANFETLSTNNTTVPVIASETYYWWVTYATGDSAHTGRQSDCAESVDLTFTNDAGPGTLFTPSP